MTENLADQIRKTDFPNFMPREVLARDQFLINHGVRHLTINGYINNDPILINRMYTMLQYTPPYGCGIASGLAIPFVIPHIGGDAMCGYASHPWIIETLEWLQSHDLNDHTSRLEGILLGYHPDAIEAEINFFSGKHPTQKN